MKTGIQLVREERLRQKKMWGSDEWRKDESLAMAAACYATPEKSREMEDFHGDQLPKNWPMKSKWWKPTPAFDNETETFEDYLNRVDDGRIRELVKAGALIVAELDRLIERKKIISPTTN